MSSFETSRDFSAAPAPSLFHARRDLIAKHGGLRGKDGGCLVDGVEHKHFPPALAA